MASKVEICNLALQNVGANSITSLVEGTAEANECSLRYDTARLALLNMHIWNFAVKRAQLARLTATPEFNYNYKFQLPTDFLYMVMSLVLLVRLMLDILFTRFWGRFAILKAIQITLKSLSLMLQSITTQSLTITFVLLS